ncbi:MAG: hypothetical protein FWH03_04205 [Firmicutes bacterium]|nr:hypothetical protein [Bacillota bacterium]
MKKHRRLIGALLTLVMAFGLLFGGGIIGAFANTVSPDERISAFFIPGSLEYMDKLSDFPLTFDNVELVITAPNGRTTDAFTAVPATAADDYIFDQVGVYRFVYQRLAGGKELYAKNVLCELVGEYELRVEYGGADIPTVTRVGREFDVPKAAIWYKTEDMDEFEKLANESNKNYTLTVTTTDRDSDGMRQGVVISEDKHKYDYPGNFTIVYSAQFHNEGGTANGLKFFTQSFNVRAQAGDFTNDSTPRLTVTGVPTYANVNTRVRLPLATATDIYEENVKVLVTVKFKGADVLTATVDRKTGFATGIEDDADPVIFDNVFHTEFFPVEKGNYDVTYTADNGWRQSATWSGRIMVEDRIAPTLREIDDWMIPQRWGKNNVNKLDMNKAADPNITDKSISVTKSVAEGGNGENGMKIRFPFPEYIDNSGTEDDDGISRVSFEIRDTVNSNTVIRFYDIYSTTELPLNLDDPTASVPNQAYRYNKDQHSQGYYMNGAEGNTMVVFERPNPASDCPYERAGGFWFDFANYFRNSELSDTEDFLGRYTAQYQARDKDQNVTTRTYDIMLESTFEDTMLPDIQVEFDNYIYLNKNMRFYTVPEAIITDAGSTRIRTEYEISTVGDFEMDADGRYVAPAKATTLSVESGERLRIVRQDGKTYLANAESVFLTKTDNKYDIAELAELSIEITDEHTLYFRVVAFDSVQNMKRVGYDVTDAPLDGVVRLVIDERMENANIELNIVTDDFSYTAQNPYNNTHDYTVGYAGFDISPERIDLNHPNVHGFSRNNSGAVNLDKFEFGSFAIMGVPDEYRDFIGFEIRLSDSAGRIQDGISLETYYVPSAHLSRAGTAANGYNTDDGTASGSRLGMIVVDNIVIDLEVGVYDVVLRAFDINGNATSVSFVITVTQDTTHGISVSNASPIDRSGDVNVTYTLKNRLGFENVDADPARPFMVRRISQAGNFSLMGSEFTAYSQGTFAFSEGIYSSIPIADRLGASGTLPRASGSSIFAAAFNRYEELQSTYHFQAIDSNRTIFEIQGVMPVYSPRNAPVLLPSVVAHNEFANAEVTVKVTNPDEGDVTVTKIQEQNDLPEALRTPSNFAKYFNGHVFTPSRDGRYTVTFEAKINQGTDEVAGRDTFVITVGDVIAPTFTLDPVSNYKTSLGDRFQFSVMYIDEEASADDIDLSRALAHQWDNISFTKRLILPDGNTHELGLDWGKQAAERKIPRDQDDVKRQDQGFLLTDAGDYTIEYIATDRAGNESKVIREFTVLGSSGGGNLPFRVIATVLIIFAVLLIAGVILYFTRFQKKKIKA